jgi:hypothetical protein
MIRLFLALISFLSVSLGGLWYGSSTDAPLDDAAFENAPLALEEKSETVVEPQIETPAPMPQPTPSAEPEKKPEEEKKPEPVPPAKAPEAPAEKVSESGGFSVQPRLLRFGYRTPSAPRGIDTIVLHSSYNAQGGDEYDLEKTIGQYETYGVGAHYIIDRKGVVYRLVDEANIAYHAGSSKMPDGRKNVNDFSIGVEIIGTLDSSYTDKQYAAVNALIASIKSRYKVKSVVGHMDIAPGRKTDPWKFDWKKLK